MQDVRKPVWQRSYKLIGNESITSYLDECILHGHVMTTGVISTTHVAPFSLGSDGCRVMRYRPDGKSHTSIFARALVCA